MPEDNDTPMVSYPPLEAYLTARHAAKENSGGNKKAWPHDMSVMLDAWEHAQTARDHHVLQLQAKLMELKDEMEAHAHDTVPVRYFDATERKRRILADEVRNLRGLMVAMVNDPDLIPALSEFSKEDKTDETD